MDQITVVKRDINMHETWRYPGRILKHTESTITIEAFFNRPDMQFHEINLREGDRFIETFFTDQWFNIFAIYDLRTDHFKGLYCNVSYPAEIEDSEISYIDLALDLLVFPDGRQIVLDQDEFELLPISKEIKKRAETALQELKIYCTEILTKIPKY